MFEFFAPAVVDVVADSLSYAAIGVITLGLFAYLHWCEVG